MVVETQFTFQMAERWMKSAKYNKELACPAVRLADNTYLVKVCHAGRIGYSILFYGNQLVTLLDDGHYILDTDNAYTKTTKKRINEFTPFQVVQRNDTWLIATGIGQQFMPFENIEKKKIRPIPRIG